MEWLINAAGKVNSGTGHIERRTGSVVGHKRHGISILAVEDDETVRRILELFIKRKFPDIPLYFAENGTRGIELFKAHAPKIVITDLIMPEMDGAEMASTLKSMKPDIRLIVVTGYGSEKTRETLRTTGFSAFLTKPIEMKALVSAIERCLTEIDSASSSA